MTALAVAPTAAAADTSPELAGTSPGERSAIEALCAASRGAPAQHMCRSNQVINLERLGRKPNLSAASPEQRQAIDAACAAKEIPAERFACERVQLRAAGLGVSDEPGGGKLHADAAAPPEESGMIRNPMPTRPAALPYFNLDKWRSERPAMPAALDASTLTPTSIYDHIAPSLYILRASNEPIELGNRISYSQGGAVAVTDHILITNCHLLLGWSQLTLTQQGQRGRATLAYADPAGDRCFVKSEDITLRPVQGIRRFQDLKVGETVFSLGAPTGLERTFGEGIISGLRQTQGVNMIQNSAPTWYGSSGGGLFDSRGNLIGITTAIAAKAQNLNFSIAAEDFWP